MRPLGIPTVKDRVVQMAVKLVIAPIFEADFHDCSFGYPSRVFRKVNHYVLKRMARFLNRKSQRYYRLKLADTYYGEMTHYGLHRLAWADVRREGKKC